MHEHQNVLEILPKFFAVRQWIAKFRFITLSIIDFRLQLLNLHEFEQNYNRATIITKLHEWLSYPFDNILI